MATTLRTAQVMIMLTFVSLLAAPARAQSVTLRLTDLDGHAIPDAVAYRSGAVMVAGSADPAPTIIDQRDKKFTPHVTVMSPGAAALFPNSDNTRHHVYSFSGANSFELKLYRANDAPPITFSEPGVVKLGCNIHDNMKAYILVTDNPSAVTVDGEGRVTLDFPEPGIYDVAIWQPMLEQPMVLSLTGEQVTAGREISVVLPIHWVDPQAVKSGAALENLLKKFSNDAR